MNRLSELILLFTRKNKNISFGGGEINGTIETQGNFKAFVKDQAKYDPVLNDHFANSHKNSLYLQVPIIKF